MTNEIEDLNRDSARLTWLIAEALEGRHHLARAGVDQHSVRAYMDHFMAPANVDAERERWCEENAATVEWRNARWVCYYKRSDGRVATGHHENRSIAIDKARGVK
jgi:hypothetical protein